MSESKECYLSNNDIVTNCIAIFEQAKPVKVKYSGEARKRLDQLKDKALLAAELDEFSHCKDIH